MRRLSLVVTSFLLLHGSAAADRSAISPPTVPQRITTDTTWTRLESPYELRNDVIVTKAATLTIEPGVRVEASPGVSITIEGVLVADGLSLDRIVFTGDDWDGIVFTYPGTGERFDDRSRLIYAIVEHATTAVTAERDSPVIANVTFDANRRALKLFNPNRSIAVVDSVFTNNRYAVVGRTRDLVSITGSAFWNNRVNLLARPQGPYDCGDDAGVWDLSGNDILRGPVNDRYFSFDMRTPPGSAESPYLVKAVSNWWGTTDEDAIAARFRAAADCCPAPMTKRILWREPAASAQTAYVPNGPVPAPERQEVIIGDPAWVLTIARPDHGECIRNDLFERIKGRAYPVFAHPPGVFVALRRGVARCGWWSRALQRFVARPCGRPLWSEVTVSDREWTYRFPRTLPAGRYLALIGPREDGRVRGVLGRERIAFRLTKTEGVRFD